MTYLIPELMAENWKKFAEAVINSELDEKTPASLFNMMKHPNGKFYIELKIKKIKEEKK